MVQRLWTANIGASGASQKGFLRDFSLIRFLQSSGWGKVVEHWKGGPRLRKIIFMLNFDLDFVRVQAVQD